MNTDIFAIICMGFDSKSEDYKNMRVKEPRDIKYT